MILSRLKNIIIAVMLILCALPSCNSFRDDYNIRPPFSDSIVSADIRPPSLYMGIDTSGYTMIEGKIRRNQFLSEILANYGISYSDIDRLANNSGETLNIRNIKAGKQYQLFINNDSLSHADYFIYNEDPATSYIFDFTDSLYIRKFEKPKRVEMKYSSGTIESSLWNAMTDNDINPVLAVELSEIYAWTIDFFGLQRGDRFKIIYEEEYIDSVSTGIKKIYGAWFSHSGTAFYAIPAIQDSTESYYDTDGNSLRKAFLKAPLRYSRISSRFSNNRMHPILRIRRPHHGVDYAAAIGTPVHAIGDGRVIKVAYDKGAGRMVKIKHNSVYATAYLHLSRYGKGISTGKYVKQGDIIGYVGSSGLSTGPHLDFRFYKNGQAVDPLKVEAPPVEPISEENHEKFEKISFTIKTLLDSFE